MSTRLKEVLAHLGITEDGPSPSPSLPGRSSGGSSSKKGHHRKEGKEDRAGGLARTASGTYIPPSAHHGAGPRYTSAAPQAPSHSASSLPRKLPPGPATSSSSTGSSAPNFAGALLTNLTPDKGGSAGGRTSDGSVTSELPPLAWPAKKGGGGASPQEAPSAAASGSHASASSTSPAWEREKEGGRGGGGRTPGSAEGSTGGALGPRDRLGRSHSLTGSEGRHLADQLAAAREFRDREREEEAQLAAVIEGIRAAATMQAPSFEQTVKAHKAGVPEKGVNGEDAPVHFHGNTGKIQWIQPSGPRRSGEGTEDEIQGVLRIDRTPSGGAMLRVTLLAAGFLIGPSGCSIRTIGKETGSDIKSWSEKAGPLCPRPSRCFVVEGRKKSVCKALEIISEAVARYVELTEGPAAGSLVHRCQVIRGLQFFYMPPPRSIVPFAAALVPRCDDPSPEPPRDDRLALDESGADGGIGSEASPDRQGRARGRSLSAAAASAPAWAPPMPALGPPHQPSTSPPPRRSQELKPGGPLLARLSGSGSLHFPPGFDPAEPPAMGSPPAPLPTPGTLAPQNTPNPELLRGQGNGHMAAAARTSPPPTLGGPAELQDLRSPASKAASARRLPGFPPGPDPSSAALMDQRALEAQRQADLHQFRYAQQQQQTLLASLSQGQGFGGVDPGLALSFAQAQAQGAVPPPGSLLDAQPRARSASVGPLGGLGLFDGGHGLAGDGLGGPGRHPSASSSFAFGPGPAGTPFNSAIFPGVQQGGWPGGPTPSARDFEAQLYSEFARPPPQFQGQGGLFDYGHGHGMGMPDFQPPTGPLRSSGPLDQFSLEASLASLDLRGGARAPPGLAFPKASSFSHGQPPAPSQDALDWAALTQISIAQAPAAAEGHAPPHGPLSELPPGPAMAFESDLYATLLAGPAPSLPSPSSNPFAPSAKGSRMTLPGGGTGLPPKVPARSRSSAVLETGGGPGQPGGGGGSTGSNSANASGPTFGLAPPPGLVPLPPKSDPGHALSSAATGAIGAGVVSSDREGERGDPRDLVHEFDASVLFGKLGPLFSPQQSPASAARRPMPLDELAAAGGNAGAAGHRPRSNSFF